MLSLFFILILVSSFAIIFDENIPIPIVSRAVNLFDEVFVVLFFIYTLIRKRGYFRNLTVAKLLLSFIIWGVLCGLKEHESLTILLLGAFSTTKAILFYWCLSQFNFKWKDFLSFLKRFDFLFVISLVSYLLDLFFPSFRYDIGIVAQAEDIRGGMRSLGGFYNRFTVATMFGMLLYIYYFYYSPRTQFNIIKAVISLGFIITTIKVKDILGVIMAVQSKRVLNIKIHYIIVTVISAVFAFLLYAKFLPEHFESYTNPDNDNIARVVENVTSVRIANDYIPFGVGFGRFASPVSVNNHYSPVYRQYGIDKVYGIRQEPDGRVLFAYDLFWPMILGETGYLGLLLYLLILYFTFKKYIGIFKKSPTSRRAIFPIYLLVFFMMCSLGKPVFAGPPHAFLFWGIAGVFYSLSGIIPPEMIRENRLMKKIKVIMKNYVSKYQIYY